MEIATSEVVATVLSEFHCVRNPDVENFLHHRAITFEQRNLSRTYLLFGKDALKRGAREIFAYFSLAIHALELADALSKNRRQELSGGDKTVAVVPAFLIGQLAKNDDFKDAISGAEVLQQALSIIKAAQKLVGGRVVTVDCKSEPKLREFYLANGFKFLGHNDANNLDQYFLKLK